MPKTVTAICVVCRKRLENIQFAKGFQPVDGLAFSTRGHYGSSYFDPMDGSYLEFCVCDECVEKLEKEGLVQRAEAPQATPRIALSEEELLAYEVIERRTLESDDGPRS